MKHAERQIIEAEVLDERGRPLAAASDTPQDEHPETARAGFFAGFVALCFSFIMILTMALVTVFVVFPLLLLGRLLGMQVHSLRR